VFETAWISPSEKVTERLIPDWDLRLLAAEDVFASAVFFLPKRLSKNPNAEGGEDEGEDEEGLKGMGDGSREEDEEAAEEDDAKEEEEEGAFTELERPRPFLLCVVPEGSGASDSQKSLIVASRGKLMKVSGCWQRLRTYSFRRGVTPSSISSRVLYELLRLEGVKEGVWFAAPADGIWMGAEGMAKEGMEISCEPNEGGEDEDEDCCCCCCWWCWCSALFLKPSSHPAKPE